MRGELVIGQALAWRASLVTLSFLPGQVLIGNAAPKMLTVLAIAALTQIMLCLLLGRYCADSRKTALWAATCVLLGVLAAAFMRFQWGYAIEKSFALIFGIVVAAVALDSYRLQRGIGMPLGFWGGLAFQGGVFLYALFA
ncbi:MAG: hypothetical protein WHS44_03590 [Fimbriimonadales bacterium]|nr:MAG: hypothetical protein KatS3mg018_1821 [Fimbriimonadales bacterium]